MQTELSQFTAIIGIDWADKKHDVCIQAVKFFNCTQATKLVGDWYTPQIKPPV